VSDIVKVGQVWLDNDRGHVEDVRLGKRPQREVRILEVFRDVATCENVATGRKTSIRLSRFRPTSTGYRLKEGS
jgi:hypothetical protein